MENIRLGRSIRFIIAGAALLGLCAFSSFAQQSQDSSDKPTGDAVADAARKAREQKKKETEKPKKVYTNEDMGELPANAVSTLGTGPGDNKDAKDADSKEQAKSAGNKDDKDPEKLWRKRFKEAYAKLAQLEKELDILQREENKDQVQYYPDPQKAMTEGYTRKDINEADAKIAAKKQEIDQQKQKISDMEDELRKAGGDPGWASP